tara:strand:+ start:414 stop:596 length:183 start_codon:yes stop_codon:yes gene_type:complete
MKYSLLIFILFTLTNCSNQVSNINDKGLDIDIYGSDMTYEKFKKIITDYADKASYPSLKN